ncbi:hypothetical protein Tco_1038552 [Tanacetum coccineum]
MTERSMVRIMQSQMPGAIVATPRGTTQVVWQVRGTRWQAELSVRGTDKTNITRKPSKTDKHGHGKRKSTKEAKDSKPKPRKVNSQSTMVNLQSKLVKP